MDIPPHASSTFFKGCKKLYRNFGKRFFELIIVILLMPLFLLASLLIIVGYLTLGHRNILFIQRRIGLHGKIFSIYKFRSLKEANQLSLLERRFAWGDFLRSTSLDELPQIWNVIRGEMALVGPRALPEEYYALFSTEENMRHMVRPGITGWAQVQGRHSLTWEQKFSYDLQYVERQSFLLDVKILVKTFTLLLSFKKDQSLEEKRFDGHGPR
jgi:undecaprenyl phosphate N,N'-diacetylbacillosamine 1-phosphate transferase